MVRTNVAEILTNHVTFELEGIDRMYLNAYVPSLQTGGGIVYFLKTQLGVRVPSTVMVAPMSQRFVDAMERFAETDGVDLIRFEKGQRKDDIAQRYLATFTGEEGVLFIGKAQEKASVFRTEKRRDARGVYPWIIRSTAMVNHYYVYLVDKDFGPLFLKFCSYFPYPAKLCLNGHEWLKRQLTQRAVPFEPLSASSRSGRCRSNRWTMGFDRPRRRPGYSGSPTRWTPPRSTRCFASGFGGCRIRSPPRTGRRAIGISSRFCKPSSR